MLKHWRLVVLAGLGLALSLYLVGASESVKSCVSQEPNGHAAKPAQKSPADGGVVVISRHCWGVFLETNDKALVGLGTVGLFLVTGVLALYTFRLWGATSELVKGAETTAERQLRAYVFAIDGRATIKDTTATLGPTVTFDIKNSGQTPAFHTRIQVEQTIAPYPPNAEFTQPAAIGGSQSLIPPGGSVSMPVGQFTITSEDRTLLDAGTHFIYVYGRIRYKDAFGKTRTTDLRYRIVNGQMLFCSGGNDAD